MGRSGGGAGREGMGGKRTTLRTKTKNKQAMERKEGRNENNGQLNNWTTERREEEEEEGKGEREMVGEERWWGRKDGGWRGKEV